VWAFWGGVSVQLKIWFAAFMTFALMPFYAQARAKNRSVDPVAAAHIEQLIRAMTLEEKVKLLGGNVFETYAIPRLRIPALPMTDGAIGVHFDLSTAFPSALSMGASFDPALITEVAAAMGDEARFRGRYVLLGPCVNINRQPFAGRNFENYGEDPFLSSQLAAGFVRGVQSQNVIATVKHLTANDQETDRQSIDTLVDTRTLMEIYLPAFKSAVDAGSLGVMTAYNKINGQYASENHFLITDILKNLWGFEGFVVSDWDSTHSTIDAANNGLDLEMPTGRNFNADLVAAVERGAVQESLVNDKVRRILRAMFAIGLIPGPWASTLQPPTGPQNPAHRALALKLAQDSLVLLKNVKHALPIEPKKIRSIALIGPNAMEVRTGGGGSSHVSPTIATSPAEEIKKRLGASVRVTTAIGARIPEKPALLPAEYLRPQMNSISPGLVGEYFASKDFTGPVVIRRIDRRFDFRDYIDWSMREQTSVRWTGFVTVPRTGEYELNIQTENHARILIDNKVVVSRWDGQGEFLKKGSVTLEAGHWYPIRIEFFTDIGWASLFVGWNTPVGNGLLQEAVLAAKNADVAVVFAGLGNDMEGEGVDRDTMAMPPGQDELIREVAKVNPRTIVVLTSGNPLSIENWLGKVPAVLQTWYPGQEGGEAIADVLLGRVSPSGKLPITYLRKWEDSPAYGNFPGENGILKYEEGIFVGYRHFDARGIAPLFSFGHGLSYTEFSYSNLKLVRAKQSEGGGMSVSFDLQNTGSVASAEVAQIYVGEENPPVTRPVRELKGFAKSFLKPGETRHYSITLDKTAFAYFDVASMSWRMTDNGIYTVSVGSSSRDLRLNARLLLTGSRR
jgi:beta-glucosidase